MVPFQQLRLSAMVERLLKLAVCFLNFFAVVMHQITFLPRCMECRCGIAMGILFVCLSVRPSNAWIVTKRKKAVFRFLYHTKEHLS